MRVLGVFLKLSARFLCGFIFRFSLFSFSLRSRRVQSLRSSVSACRRVIVRHALSARCSLPFTSGRAPPPPLSQLRFQCAARARLTVHSPAARPLVSQPSAHLLPLPAMRRIMSAVGVAAVAPAMRAVRPAAASRPLHTLRSTAASASASPAAAAAAASFSTHASAGANAATPAPLVAPAFGTQSHTDARFMYLKGVKADGRSKRFYAKVGVVPVQTSRGAEFALQLDGRYVVTPHDHVISCPTRAAAMAIAFEWDSQGDFIRPISMPMVRQSIRGHEQMCNGRHGGQIAGRFPLLICACSHCSFFLPCPDQHLCDGAGPGLR